LNPFARYGRIQNSKSGNVSTRAAQVRDHAHADWISYKGEHNRDSERLLTDRLDCFQADGINHVRRKLHQFCGSNFDFAGIAGAVPILNLNCLSFDPSRLPHSVLKGLELLLP
jgi:hypothetical protein